MSQSISDIPGVSGEILQLFQAAGFSETPDLLASPEDDVLTRLEAANEEHQLVRRMPSQAAVKAWCSAARVIEKAGSHDEKVPLTAETMRKVHESAIMHARPVPGRELVKAGIEVSAVPVADFVGEPRRKVGGEGDRKRERGDGTENRRRSSRRLRPAEVADRRAAEVEEPSADGEEKVVSLPEAQGGTKIYNLKAREEVSPEVPLEEAAPEFASVGGEGDAEEEPVVARAPAPSDPDDVLRFRGIDEMSMSKKGLERRNSGMTHKNPNRVVFSALSTLIAVLGGGLSGFALVTLGAYHVAANKPFPMWMVVLLVVTVLLGGQYLVLGPRARCRLCGQRLFVGKSCLKHQKAPRSFLGSSYATAVQVLTHKSWRCMFCGTKQKLR